MNIIITRALNMEFEEKDLAAKVFHGNRGHRTMCVNYGGRKNMLDIR